MKENSLTYHQQIEYLAKEVINLGSVERDQNHLFSKELWQACGALKLQGIFTPEEYNGKGFTIEESMNALTQLGFSCTDSGFIFSLSAHLLACVVPIVLFGTDEQKQKYLPKLSNGDWIGAHAMTEKHSGSDVFQLQTTAKKTKEGYLLNGTKSYVSNGSIADVIITYALTEGETGDQEITAFLVDQETAYESSPPIKKMGLCSCPMSSLTFKNTLVPNSAVLGKLGTGVPIFMQTMDWERLGISAGQIGIMKRMLLQNIQQAKNRKVAGNSIGNFQAIAHKIAEMEIQLKTSEALVKQAILKLGKSRSIGKDIAITKVFVSRTYRQMTQESMQLFGGKGFLQSSEIEREVRNAMASTIYSGTTEVLLNSIAKWSGL